MASWLMTSHWPKQLTQPSAPSMEWVILFFPWESWEGVNISEHNLPCRSFFVKWIEAGQVSMWVKRPRAQSRGAWPVECFLRANPLVTLISLVLKKTWWSWYYQSHFLEGEVEAVKKCRKLLKPSEPGSCKVRTWTQICSIPNPMFFSTVTKIWNVPQEVTLTGHSFTLLINKEQT